jgi:hypothetical protein
VDGDIKKKKDGRKRKILKQKKMKPTSGLYYKTITIVIMTIVSDATIWSITYDRN